jgi:RNA polymerase sigma-70 factor (ECF subfamily)
MTDKILIQHYLSWDEWALEKLLEKHLQNIFSACYRVCLDETDANDISQNVLIKIIKNLKKFWFKSEFSTWYYRIAYNESINFLKKKKWHVDIDLVENSIPYHEDVWKQIDEKILNKQVTAEINKLSLIERNIILYFYYDDLKIKEISEIVDLNENTIKTKLSRAKKKLKYNLELLWKN